MKTIFHPGQVPANLPQYPSKSQPQEFAFRRATFSVLAAFTFDVPAGSKPVPNCSLLLFEIGDISPLSCPITAAPPALPRKAQSSLGTDTHSESREARLFQRCLSDPCRTSMGDSGGRPSPWLGISPGRRQTAAYRNTYKMSLSPVGLGLRPAARAGGRSPGGFLEVVASASAGGS